MSMQNFHIAISLRTLVCLFFFATLAAPSLTAQNAPLEASSQLTDFEHRNAHATLVAATREHFKNNSWTAHKTQLLNATLESIKKRRGLNNPTALDAVFARNALPLALAQLALMRRMGNDEFAEWVAEAGPFAEKLLTNAETLEKFITCLAPENNVLQALRIWKTLDAKAATPELQKKYENLAIALALIHDKTNKRKSAYDKAEVGEQAAVAAYDFYVKTDSRHRLYVEFDKIPPDELVWSVGPSAFDFASLEWAQTNIKFTFDQLGRAYASIAYRMNHPEYPTYTMENIRKLGGICGDRTNFTVGNARAHGVPAAFVSGEGSRGGHAWAAIRGKRGWNNVTGRYSGDDYACGHATHPQTGKPFREWDFPLYEDPDRRNGNFIAARRLMRAAALMGTNNEPAAQLELLEAATLRNRHNPATWNAWFRALLKDKTERPITFWERIVTDQRNALRKFPDHLELGNQIEDEKIFPKRHPDQVGAILSERRSLFIRANPERHDLLLESINREEAFYKARNDSRRIRALYINTLRVHGHRLPLFQALTSRFAEATENDPAVRHSGVLIIEKLFNEKIDSKNKGHSDAFRLGKEADVCRAIAQMFEQDKDEKKAQKYAKRAEEISSVAKGMRTAMR